MRLVFQSILILGLAIPALCSALEADFDGKTGVVRDIPNPVNSFDQKDLPQPSYNSGPFLTLQTLSQDSGDILRAQKGIITETGEAIEVSPSPNPEDPQKAYYTFRPAQHIYWQARCPGQAGQYYNVCATYKFIPAYGGHNHSEYISGYTWYNSTHTIPVTTCANNIPVTTAVRWDIMVPEFATRSEESMQYTGACNATNYDIVDIKIDALKALPPAYSDSLHGGSTYYVLIGTTAEHLINHFGKSQTIDLLQAVAWRYYSEFPSSRISVNDMSLKWGGLFDVGRDSAANHIPWKPPHHEHRYGRQADVRRQGLTETQQRRLVEIACDKGISVLIETKDGSFIDPNIVKDLLSIPAARAPHFHLRFPKYDNDTDNPPDVLPEDCPPAHLK